ncbi:hypothetical protein [Actinomycetospora sp. TBRC 11914]|uniref:hypothetical protein n=1 Tax=Actinomycetospora sp. TBRC 11914 TaxID=2729387 RepID=UPI00145EA63F|nr:hypothetical protein [Actinomycetospora sp. TBRC 11914]NMO89059.1 hypothetical protein [Actinomycetospora sp. TBRC 11914]
MAENAPVTSPAAAFERVADARNEFERVIEEARARRRAAAAARGLAVTERQAARARRRRGPAPGTVAGTETSGSCAPAPDLG